MLDEHASLDELQAYFGQDTFAHDEDAPSLKRILIMPFVK